MTPRGWGRPACAAPALLLACAAATASAGSGAALDHLTALRDPATGGVRADSLAPTARRAVEEWVMLAHAAAGEDPRAGVGGRPGPATVLGPRPAEGSPIALARWVMAARVSRRLTPGDRAGARRQLEAALSASPDTLTLAWAVLGARAAGAPAGGGVVRDAVGALRTRQGPGGGWSRDGGDRADTPTTGAAVQALVAADVATGDPVLVGAREWLRSTRRRDGGFPTVRGGPGTGLDTAWAVLAVTALGESVRSVPWTVRGAGPAAFLLRLQDPGGGVADRRGGGPVPVVTAMTVLALRGGRLPLAVPAAGVAVDRVPTVVARSPAPGSPPGGTVTVVYRDDAGGTGVDPVGVRMTAGGRDVTGRARVTPFTLQIPSEALGALPTVLRLTLADRAGNTRVLTWVVAAQ